MMVVVLLGLTACTNHSPSTKVDRRYVAIGDSYVSGPGIPDQDTTVPQCVRSDRNYPHLLDAKLKRTTLVDVSCGGANTSTVVDGLMNVGQPLPPQLDALSPSTKLVTVGIGANDNQLFLGLFVHCLVKTSAKESACRKFADSDATPVYPATQHRVEAILADVKKRAPQARVLLVGYLRIVPDSGECPALPMTEANRARAMKVEVALNSALRDAARSAHVKFVDVRGNSHGHDACAGKDAWVNGAVPTVAGNGAVLHPNKAGMRAVEEQVFKAVGRF